MTSGGVFTEFVVPTGDSYPLRHHCRPRRRPLVYGGVRQQDRPGYHRRGLYRVSDSNGLQRSCRHHGGARRRTLVHGVRWREDRPNHHRGSRFRVHDSPDQQHPPRRNNSRPRRRPLVHGVPRQQDRPAHRLREPLPNSRFPRATAVLTALPPDPTGHSGLQNGRRAKIGRITTAGVITEFLLSERPKPAFRHRGRRRRRSLVRGVRLHLQDRPDHDRGSAHRVRDAWPALRDHGRLRRRPLVHRVPAYGNGDRPDRRPQGSSPNSRSQPLVILATSRPAPTAPSGSQSPAPMATRSAG